MINLELRVNKLITGTESLVWLLQVRKLRLQRRETAQPVLGFALLLFSGEVVSDSLRPQGLYPTRLLCSPLSPRDCSNSYPLSGWCCLTISFSATPFSLCLQSFPASGSLSRLFTSDGQSIGASATVLPVNIQGWFKIDWFDLLAVQGTLKNLLQHHSLKASFLWHLAFLMAQLSHT